MKKQKSILKRQSSMKVILNGGKFELDDATIPFQIGFDESIAEKKPAYVLVMDVTNPFDENGKRCSYDFSSERKLFKLEPIQYLQLKKPGVHHLIFILLGEISESSKKFLLEKSNRMNYENGLYFNSIEQLELFHKRQISYCETVISVPEEFFAIKPKTGIKKMIWQWVNLWNSFDPIDQCEYRKRAIFAFTIQPIFWLIGFLVRLILVTLWTVLFLVFKTFALIFGYQPVKFIPYKKKVWYEFLILYPREGFSVLDLEDWVYRIFDGNLEEGYYPYKTLAVGKKRMHIPVTLAGVIFYIGMFSIYAFMFLTYFYADLSAKTSISVFLVTIMISFCIMFLAVSQTLPTLKESEKWKEKWNYSDGEKLKQKVRLWIFSILTGMSLLLYMITQIPWAKVFLLGVKAVIFLLILLLVCVCFYFLFKSLFKTAQKIKKNIKQKQFNQKDKEFVREVKHKEWLLGSFNINNLPKKVDLGLMPESSSPVHKFVIGFWQTKAKVCKPYSK